MQLLNFYIADLGFTPTSVSVGPDTIWLEAQVSSGHTPTAEFEIAADDRQWP